jgi:hypothetical protein
MNNHQNSGKEREDAITAFWSGKRLPYNKGLVISGVTAFIFYCILGSIFVKDFEVTGFTTILQGFGYLIMMGIANIFYGLGSLIDGTFNEKGSEKFRNNLYKFGFVFSVALPFSIPVSIAFYYF